MYLVKIGPRVRFCHADHLLDTVLENIDSEPDTVVVLLIVSQPRLNYRKKLLMSNVQAPKTQPLQRSARESQAPCRLIEELQEPLYIF